jgi:hypothetical protein
LRSIDLAEVRAILDKGMAAGAQSLRPALRSYIDDATALPLPVKG